MRIKAGTCITVLMVALIGLSLLLLPSLKDTGRAISGLIKSGPTGKIEEMNVEPAAMATQTSLMATQVWIQGRIQQDLATQDARIQASTWSAFTPVCLTWAVTATLLYLFYKWATGRINGSMYQDAIVETRVGTVAWVDQYPQLLGENPGIGRPAPPRVTVMGKPVEPALPEPQEDTQSLAKQLMILSARQADDTDKVLGWRQVPGWTSGKWQRVMSALRQAGVRFEADKSGTRIVDGTASDVYYDLDLGKIKLN